MKINPPLVEEVKPETTPEAPSAEAQAKAKFIADSINTILAGDTASEELCLWIGDLMGRLEDAEAKLVAAKYEAIKAKHELRNAVSEGHTAREKLANAQRILARYEVEITANRRAKPDADLVKSSSVQNW